MKLDIDKIVKQEEDRRAGDLYKIQCKLSQVSYWEKKAVSLSDKTFGPTVKERLQKLQEILIKEGFVANLKAIEKWDPCWLEGTLSKGQLSIDVIGRIVITGRGEVGVELLKKEKDSTRWSSYQLKKKSSTHLYL